MKKLELSIIIFIASLSINAFAQAPEDWFNRDRIADGVQGVSTDKAYELLKGRESKPVVVAIIDSGVDLEHEDLADILWVNSGEVPNNGKDDDGNGYIDDVHGWSFLGGPGGKNIKEETLEHTRLYRFYKKKYGEAKRDMLNGKQKEEYDRWIELKESFDAKREELQGSIDRVKSYFTDIDAGIKMLEEKGLEINEESLEKLPTDTDKQKEIKAKLNSAMNQDMDFKNLDQYKNQALDYYNLSLNYYYNPDFNPRPEIVGDDYSNQTEKYYGNNDAEGPDAAHGTHVAGIVAAIRGNGVGMDGIADNVKIMSVRAVPDGDERDKDVANAIRYAVDNGASVINMSFGKGFSWNKKIVDDAVKYAAKNDVLLVHAAGNSSQNNDETDNFPTDIYDNKCLFFKKRAKNWIEVGALTYKPSEEMVAPFSNYGKKQVDIFAPGYQIYSAVPQSDYARFSGTSMASPVVAGVAALIRSYYPKLSAKKVKKILLKSAVEFDEDVKLPGDPAQLVNFNELSRTGGVVNAYRAVKMAM